MVESADRALVRRFSDLATEILTSRPRLGGVRLAAVDGPAGSGKTTFAGKLAEALRAAGAATCELHTDDLLDDWTDIMSFWPRLENLVLSPLAAGRPGRYKAFDWVTEQFTPEQTVVPVPDVLLVEGVASARPAGRAWFGTAVYVVAPRSLRLARGLARDGMAVRARWLHWMAEEDRYFAALPAVTTPSGPAATTPGEPIIHLVEGAPDVRHDPRREYVLAGAWPGEWSVPDRENRRVAGPNRGVHRQ